MDIIAFYLPQYYTFPENDRWWGQGFTEWTNVKKSKPLYKGHYQPVVPLNNNYYSLEDIETMKWQVELAKKYGVSGFFFFFYWFGEGRKLMEKPVEKWLKHTEIEYPYCLCWANHNWSRTWVGGDKDILMDVRYGDENEWEEHFLYLLPFFRDSRYIHIDNKPVLVIYQPQLISNISEMIPYLQKRAKEEGFQGLTIISQVMHGKQDDLKKYEEYVDYNIQYEPVYSNLNACSNKLQTLQICPRYFFDLLQYKLLGGIKKITFGHFCNYRTYSYDAIWSYILKKRNNDNKMLAGAFVKCDVTPRRQERALIYKGASPEKFSKYMKRLVEKVKKEYHQQMIFVSAWNEWGEGMYLEPDEKDKYKYLEGVRDAIK